MTGVLSLIKAVIFDFGNVIAAFNHMKTCDELAHFTTLSTTEIYSKIFSSGLIRQYEEGRITSLRFYEMVSEQIRADKALTFSTFAEIWKDIFIENHGIEIVLDSLWPAIKMVLLSNTNELHWDRMAQLPTVRKYFYNEQDLVLSFRLGFCKPDKRIFLETIQRCGCAPEEVIYVDDVSDYVKTFERFGGKGVIYNCQTDPIENLTRELARYSVLRSHW